MASRPTRLSAGSLLAGLLSALPATPCDRGARPQTVPPVLGDSEEGPKVGPLIAVVGRLVRGGRPVPRVEIVTWRIDPRIELFLGPCSCVGGPTSRARSSDDGTFELAAHAGSAYCIRTEHEGHKFPDLVIDIPREPGTMDVSLPVCLSGSVVDQLTRAPVADAAVIGGEGLSWSGGYSTTGSDGKFHLDLQPGDHSIWAHLDEEAVAHQEVSLGETGLSGLVLSLVPARQIKGRVVDETGRGVAEVDVWAEPRPPLGGFATTGPDGSFNLGGLLDRRYVLGARSESKSQYAIQDAVQPGDGEAVVQLRDTGFVTVRVGGTEGRPVGDAFVEVTSIDGRPSVIPIAEIVGANGLAELSVPQGWIALAVKAPVEEGRWEVVGEATVSVRERESVSTVISVDTRPVERL